MLRALVVVLLLANALVFAWTEGWLGGAERSEREPERLQRQVQPELVKLVAPGAASAALAAAAQMQAASEAAASAAPSGLCLEAGPLAPAAVAGAEKALQQAGVAAASWVHLPAERKGVFLIYMGRYADDEALERKIEELKRLRIDAQPMKNASELQPGLVISRFDDKVAAEAELGRLSQRGLRTARVITLVPPTALVTLRLPAAEPALRDKLAALKLAPGVNGFGPCAPAAPATGASAASAPAVVAAAASVPSRAAPAPSPSRAAPASTPSRAASAAVPGAAAPSASAASR